MLRSLQVRNYILIDSLDIDFPEGLIIITGQTGAGKSILLGALSLLSGAKADASMISGGAESCVVEAEFGVSDPVVSAMLEEEEVETGGDTLTIRRVIARSGRSRSFINDCPVQVVVLQRVFDRLVDIHSQHRSLLLTDKSFQLSLLDCFAGNGTLLDGCRQRWREYRAVSSQLSELMDNLSRMENERDYNAARFAQLDAAALREGELESLEAEQKSLANAEQIKDALERASSAFSPGEEFPGIAAALKDARKQLEHIGKYLPDAGPLAERIDSARIELEDISDELDKLDDAVSISPERLQAVEDRMSLIYSLLTRFGCSDVAGLIAERDRLSEMLFDTDSLSGKVGELRKKQAACHEAFVEMSKRLSEARKAAVPGLSAAVSESLHFLELERAVFDVRLEDAPESECGCDRVSFLFSATGKDPVDVSKCASGGEMSRIMLSLKSLMARFTGMPTMIFDEIDTGVSGSVADKMGRMICSMGQDMQVFSITHLPQVAAKGDAHYVVSKEISPEGRAVSSVRRLDGDERVYEIARLLSGADITDAAVANARCLLDGR